jgi:polyhydroxybutyrate depolymerase
MKHITSPRSVLAFATVAVLSALLTASPVAAEDTAQQTDRDYTATLEWAGFERTYHVHVPASYDGTSPVPLVVGLHYGLGNAKIFQDLSGFDAVADREGFIIAYPEGYKTAWGGTGLDTPPEKEGTDDIGFISALIDTMNSKYQVKPDRIHLVGMCNGGYLAQVLAVELSDTIASFATATATSADIFSDAYDELPRPVAIMFVNGTKDKYIPFAGGTLPLTPDTSVWPTMKVVGNWASLNGCSSKPTETELPDAADDGTRIRRLDYPECAGDAEVVLYVVEGAGHTWPGGKQYQPEQYIGITSQDMKASDVIWEFFERHPMPGAG